MPLPFPALLANFRSAACLTQPGTEGMVANTPKNDPDSLAANKAAADKIKEQTHESIMKKNRAIVDDVLASED